MQLTAFTALLAMGPPASGGQQTAAPWYIQFFPFILLLGVFYLALIRPQQKKAKEHADLLKNIRNGDRIVTNGGVVGVVITVKETTLTLRSADTKLEVLKSAVTQVTERGGGSSES